MGRGSMLTVEQTAKRLAVSEAAVYRALREGRLPGGKILGTWRVDPDRLDRWIESQQVPRAHKPAPSDDILAEVHQLRRSA